MRRTHVARRFRGRRCVAVVAVGLGLTVVLGMTGCVPSGADSPSPAPLPPAESVTSGPATVSAGPITEPSLPTPSSPKPSAGGLHVTQSVISGHSGSVSWRVRVPTFSGAPAASEVNKRVRAAVNDLISQAKREGRQDDGDKRRLEGEGTVVTNDGRTAQVTIDYGDYLAGTAHPTDYVTTTVVDVARRRPVTLEQVFENPTAAYEKLKPEILKAAGEQSSSIDQAGLAPKPANWANWQTDDTGMIFVFGDYQLGTHGLREYAVPWSAVEPLMTGYGKRVLAPQ